MIDTRPLTVRLLSEASQENCDGIEHNLMIEAYHKITKLEARVSELEAALKLFVYTEPRDDCACANCVAYRLIIKQPKAAGE
jgi:hypothetical protein